MSGPPERPRRPPWADVMDLNDPANLEKIIGLALMAGRLALGDEAVREVFARAMGDPPKVVMGP